MTDHVRKQIRDAAVTALTGLTTTGARVKNNPVYPLQEADLPGLRVFTRNESSEPIELGVARTRERTLDLFVEGCVKSISGYGDTVDLICKEVEIALDANNGLGGLCKYIEPSSFVEDQDGTSEKPIAIGRMLFKVVYNTQKGSPDVAA